MIRGGADYRAQESVTPVTSGAVCFDSALTLVCNYGTASTAIIEFWVCPVSSHMNATVHQIRDYLLL